MLMCMDGAWLVIIALILEPLIPCNSFFHLCKGTQTLEILFSHGYCHTLGNRLESFSSIEGGVGSICVSA